jgi:hypothetical protein
MLETITSKSIEPISAISLGSSSTDGEDKDFLMHNYFTRKSIYPAGIYFSYDIASLARDMSINFRNETFGEIETIPEEMLEHDIFIKMPPKRRRTVKFKIKSIRKAKPRIVIPEYPYIDI